MKIQKYLALFFTMLFFQTSVLYAYEVPKGNESAFDGTQNLTEQEEKDAKTYLHQGINQKEYDKICDPNDPAKFDACTNLDNSFAHGKKFLGINLQDMEKIVPVVGKLYSMFGNMIKLDKYDKASKGTEGGKYHKADGEGFTDKKSEAKKKEQQDYCAMAATAGELIATATQNLKQDQVQQNYEQNAQEKTSQQIDALAAVKEAQITRAKTSKMQAYTWGGTAACYGVMMATGTVINAKSIAKMAAAGLLATFYGFKTDAHKKRAESIQALIDKLPKAGDCNPHTNTSCFCSEETSLQIDPANYQKYCTPREYQDRFAKNPVSCVDANKKVDHECKCLKTKSCISSAFTGPMAQLQFGTNSAVDPLSYLRNMEGGFDDGKLAADHARNMAFAKKVLNQLKPDELSKMVLNDEQKKLAETFANNGVPKIAAAMLATQPVSPKAGAATLGLGSDGGLSGLYNKSGSAKAASYDSKSSRNSFGRKKSNSQAYNPFAKFGKKEAKSNSAVQIEDYSSLAEKAYADAQISKDTSRPIFDIITYRYKLSAWKRFEDQINKEIAEESKTSEVSKENVK